MGCVLGLDIGTTSTIGILIQLPDKVLGIASRPVTLSTPRPGWMEEDPQQWWRNVCSISRQLLSENDLRADELRAVGVTGMVPALVLVDQEGDLLRPSIQQSDARSTREVDELQAAVDEAAFLRRTGNGINQQLIAPRLRWLAANEPGVFSGIATAFGSYDYINWCLTDRRVVERNWALEAGILDLGTGEIADDLVGLTGLPRNAVPNVVGSGEIIGVVTAAASEETGIPEGVPVIGGGADHIASALGAGAAKAGQVLIKFGGSVDILTTAASARPDPRLYLDYHFVPDLFMPNGCMATGGSGLNWFAETFAAADRSSAEASNLTLHQYLDILAAPLPAGADGLTIVPYFAGEKSPVHDPQARGIFSGVTLSHGRGHFWRAMLEAYAYGLAHNWHVLSELGYPLEDVIASDGGSASDLWMQIVADVLQKPVRRVAGHPGSCLGIAWVAAIAAGLDDDWAGATRFTATRTTIEPNPANRDIYRDGYREYRRLYNVVSGSRSGTKHG